MRVPTAFVEAAGLWEKEEEEEEEEEVGHVTVFER